MSFEKMRVYQAAVLLDKHVIEFIRKLPPGNSRDIDQLKRACGSVQYNIAEAYGSESPGRKAGFLEIARGSTDEVRAIARRLARINGLPPTSIYPIGQVSIAVAKMLTSWIRTIAQKR